MVTHVHIPPLQGKNSFIEGKRKLGGAVINHLSMASHWPIWYQERREVFFLLGSAIITGHKSAPFWSPDSI